MERNREAAAYIIDEFETLLNEKEIIIPSEDRKGSDKEAAIYGKEYYQLEDRIKTILDVSLFDHNVKENENLENKAAFVHNLGILLSQTNIGISSIELEENINYVKVVYNDSSYKSIRIYNNCYFDIIVNVCNSLK